MLRLPLVDSRARFYITEGISHGFYRLAGWFGQRCAFHHHDGRADRARGGCSMRAASALASAFLGGACLAALGYWAAALFVALGVG
jgi:hypothetical protein